MFQTQLWKNQNTHAFYVQYLFILKKSCSLRDNVEKCGTAGHATDDNTAHARAFCMLDNEGNRHSQNM